MVTSGWAMSIRPTLEHQRVLEARGQAEVAAADRHAEALEAGMAVEVVERQRRLDPGEAVLPEQRHQRQALLGHRPGGRRVDHEPHLRAHTWLKQPFLTSAWSMRPPGEGLAVAYTQDAKWKETHWERPEYDALLLKANTTVDPEERTDCTRRSGACSPRRAA